MPRQQTLRAAIEWSYAPLSEVEQAMLQRLGVFASRSHGLSRAFTPSKLVPVAITSTASDGWAIRSTM